MKEKKKVALLKYLKKAGFQGKELEYNLGKTLGDANPKFTIDHIIRKSEALMRFRLKFEWDMQFDAYRFMSYHVTYRSKVFIDNRKVGDFQTGELEDRMSDVDWAHWFRDGKKTMDEDTVLEIEAILAIISDLSASLPEKDSRIIDELCYKYFPPEYYVGRRLEEFQREYEKSREFIAYPSGICHANLAYHVLSGNLDGNYEMLLQTGLQEFPGIDIYGYLEDRLKYDPEEFTFLCEHNTPEGFIRYEIELEQTEEGFIASDNTVTFTPHPEIEHAIINGVDTTKLESALRDIDWNNDELLYVFDGHDEVALLPDIQAIKDKMDLLEATAEGKEIALLLQLKYWTDSPFMQSFIEDSTWNKFHARDSFTATFPLNWDARLIYNLMCGRYVMDYPLGLEGSNPATWVKLDWSDSKGFFHRIHGPVERSIDAMLDLLPFDDKYRTRTALKKGDEVWQNIRTAEGLKEIKLVMDPEANTIRVYDKLGIEVPYNFRLSSQEHKYTKANIAGQQKPANRSKGRGI